MLAEIIAETLEVRTNHSTSQRNWRPCVRGLWRLLDYACFLSSLPTGTLRLRCNRNVWPRRDHRRFSCAFSWSARGKLQAQADQRGVLGFGLTGLRHNAFQRPIYSG